ncbi:hypothetical protein [Pacificoceanicola onchidii]|uniref:hypothetical protein n=1 Tax=Pacificoceanicola onchidii TaxID=2562685 RepID=UPI0010A4A7C1|nr:hypothetical protein [Pacificoceanicola onchidii]
MPQARDTYQVELDALTASVMDRDVDAFLRRIRLPHTMATVDSMVVHETEKSAACAFHRYLDVLEERGVTRVVRNCISARVDPLGILEGYHQTRLFAGEKLATPPFSAQMRFERQADGRWLNFLSQTGNSITVFPFLPEESACPPPDGVAAKDIEAFGIFQDLLNVVTQHYLTGNVEGLHAAIAYPISMVSRQGETRFESFEEMKADFDLYMQEFRIYGVTDIVRTVSTARPLGPDRIKGRYKTYVMNHERILVDPYESEMTLERQEDGTWRMREVLHALGHMNWHRDLVQ